VNPIFRNCVEKGKEPALSLEVVSLAHVYTQFKAGSRRGWSNSSVARGKGNRYPSLALARSSIEH